MSYRTSNLTLAACLLSAGFEPVSIDIVPNEDRKLFVFQNTVEILSIVSGFKNNTHLVNPKNFHHALRTIKIKLKS